MQGEVAEKIIIREPNKELRDWCKETLIINNPEYAKKQAMGLWTGNIPRQFCLYEEVGDSIILPFGCLYNLHERFPDMPLESHIMRSEGFSYLSRINTYPYQEKAVEAVLERKNGVLVMPCGSGKTQTALEAVDRIGMRCLWITHTQDLLNQSMNRAKSVYDAAFDSYGTITEGKVKIGRGITFATVQTASKVDLTPYRNEFGVIIVDECHKAVGSPTKAMQFYRVLSSLSCRYKIGLTATPKRSDGLSDMMFALLGGIIHEVSREEVAGNTCPVEVMPVRTGYMPSMDMALCGDGTINYAGLVADLTGNVNRFQLVLDHINRYAHRGAMLVLGNRVEYLKQLCKEYTQGKAVCLSGAGNSKTAKAERKAALNALNEGELDCVFATYALAREGLDVPNLRYVVFSTPEKDPTTIEQASGRVGRKADGKSYGTVIDFVDEFGMYKGWWKKRLSVYKKLGYVIIE